VAFEVYKKQAISKHQNFQCSDAVFFIDVANQPYLGTSPDSLVNCSCYRGGHGVLEINCPFCFKDALPDDTTAERSYYMEKNDDKK